MRHLRSIGSLLLLALFTAQALGTQGYSSGWRWTWQDPHRMDPQRPYEYLTGNNGAHAVSLTKYGSSPEKVWVNVVTGDQDPSDDWRAFAHQYDDFLTFKDTTTIRTGAEYFNVCVAAAADAYHQRKVVTFSE